MRRRLATLLLAALAALAAVPAGALSAGGESTGGVAVTPGLVDTDLPSRAVDLPFTLSNSESAPVRVALSVVALTLAPDGTPVYGEPVPGLVPAVPDVLIQPGQQARVRVTGAIPGDAPSLSAALLAEPRRAGRGDGGGVTVRTRVAALLLLRGPGAATESVTVEDLALASTGRPGSYRVAVLLRNTGDRHVRPAGGASVHEPGGAELTAAPLGTGVLLPGAARWFAAGTWTAPAEAPARVLVRARIDHPAATGERLISLDEVPEAAPAHAEPTEPSAALAALGSDGPRWPVALAAGLLLVTGGLLAWQGPSARRRRLTPG